MRLEKNAIELLKDIEARVEDQDLIHESLDRCEPEMDFKEAIDILDSIRPIHYGDNDENSKEQRNKIAQVCLKLILFTSNCKTAGELPF